MNHPGIVVLKPAKAEGPSPKADLLKEIKRNGIDWLVCNLNIRNNGPL